jgi:hypothetical protein
VNRATMLRAVLAFTVLALSVVYVLTKSPRLGLALAPYSAITSLTFWGP